MSVPNREVLIDPLSRTPYPIILNEVIEYSSPLASWHHPIFNAKDERLNSPGGQAVRESFVELLTVGLHNTPLGDDDSYHDVFKGSGDWLPANDDDCFDMIIPGIAGYISDYGIDLSCPAGEYLQLQSPEQRAVVELPAKVIPPFHRHRIERLMAIKAETTYGRLENPSVTLKEFVSAAVSADRVRQATFSRHHFSYDYSLVRDFFRQYVVMQEMGHVTETVEQYTDRYTTDDEKLRLGRTLLEEALRVATDRVASNYVTMHRNGNLHPQMPSDVVELVKHKLGNQAQRDYLMVKHGAAMAENLGLAPAA